MILHELSNIALKIIKQKLLGILKFDKAMTSTDIKSLKNLISLKT